LLFQKLAGKMRWESGTGGDKETETEKWLAVGTIETLIEKNCTDSLVKSTNEKCVLQLINL
jgi:hypothetical protein